MSDPAIFYARHVDPEFEKALSCLDENHWVRYDLSAVRLGWEMHKEWVSVSTEQENAEKLTNALKLASRCFNRSTKYGRGWHDALAYVKQAVLKQEGEG